jgi:excisionase family DNA binding protein
MSGFVTVQEFLSTYRISKASLYRLVARNELRLLKLGRSSRIDRKEAEDWARNLPSIGGVPTDPSPAKAPASLGDER